LACNDYKLEWHCAYQTAARVENGTAANVCVWEADGCTLFTTTATTTTVTTTTTTTTTTTLTTTTTTLTTTTTRFCTGPDDTTEDCVTPPPCDLTNFNFTCEANNDTLNGVANLTRGGSCTLATPPKDGESCTKVFCPPFSFNPATGGSCTANVCDVTAYARRNALFDFNNCPETLLGGQQCGIKSLEDGAATSTANPLATTDATELSGSGTEEPSTTAKLITSTTEPNTTTTAKLTTATTESTPTAAANRHRRNLHETEDCAVLMCSNITWDLTVKDDCPNTTLTFGELEGDGDASTAYYSAAGGAGAVALIGMVSYARGGSKMVSGPAYTRF